MKNRLKDQYARDHGYEPGDSWILIVHPDGRTEYYPFDDPDRMWCCARQDEILAQLDQERLEMLREPGAGADQWPPWPPGMK